MAEPASAATPVRLTAPELAARLRWTPQYVRLRRLKGLNPRFIKAGSGKNGRVLYALEDAEAFERERTFGSTTESQNEIGARPCA